MGWILVNGGNLPTCLYDYIYNSIEIVFIYMQFQRFNLKARLLRYLNTNLFLSIKGQNMRVSF